MPSKVSFKVTGGKSVAKALKDAAIAHRQKVKRGLYRWSEMLVTEIKENWVPVHDGILKSSVKATLPQEENGVIFVMIYAGDAATPYAIAVHEHLSEFSPPSWKAAEAAGRPVQFHPPGRGPKFIQTPLLQRSDTLADFILAETKL